MELISALYSVDADVLLKIYGEVQPVARFRCWDEKILKKVQISFNKAKSNSAMSTKL